MTWSPHFQSMPRTTLVPILSSLDISGPGIVVKSCWKLFLSSSRITYTSFFSGEANRALSTTKNKQNSKSVCLSNQNTNQFLHYFQTLLKLKPMSLVNSDLTHGCIQLSFISQLKITLLNTGSKNRPNNKLFFLMANRTVLNSEYFPRKP